MPDITLKTERQQIIQDFHAALKNIDFKNSHEFWVWSNKIKKGLYTILLPSPDTWQSDNILKEIDSRYNGDSAVLLACWDFFLAAQTIYDDHEKFYRYEENAVRLSILLYTSIITAYSVALKPNFFNMACVSVVPAYSFKTYRTLSSKQVQTKPKAKKEQDGITDLFISSALMGGSYTNAIINTRFSFFGSAALPAVFIVSGLVGFFMGTGGKIAVDYLLREQRCFAFPQGINAAKRKMLEICRQIAALPQIQAALLSLEASTPPSSPSPQLSLYDGLRKRFASARSASARFAPQLSA